MPEPAGPSWSLYLVQCGDGTLYTGIALDVDARLDAHREGRRGARYLRGRAPLTVVFRQPVGERGQAQRLEARVKKLRRSEKLQLVAGTIRLADLGG